MEAYIPKNERNGFMLKLWNATVEPCKRELRRHSHMRFEIAVFKSGTGKYTTVSGVHDIAAGDIFIFPSNEQHCITQINSGKPFSFMNIHFEPRYIWGSKQGGFSSDNLNICFSHGKSFCNRLPRGNEYTEKIRHCVMDIEKECTDKGPEYELVVHNRICEILVTLLRHLDYGPIKALNSDEYNHFKAVCRAIDYIGTHLDQKITLEILAEEAGLSPNYLSSVFKRIVGVPMCDYVNEKRIESAMYIIDNAPPKNMLEIAYSCGYNNTANFNKMFRRYTGITPKEYKNHGNSQLY